MKIQKIVDSYRNDFNAILECEHCYSTKDFTVAIMISIIMQKFFPL